MVRRLHAYNKTLNQVSSLSYKRICDTSIKLQVYAPDASCIRRFLNSSGLYCTIALGHAMKQGG